MCDRPNRACRLRFEVWNLKNDTLQCHLVSIIWVRQLRGRKQRKNTSEALIAGVEESVELIFIVEWNKMRQHFPFWIIRNCSSVVNKTCKSTILKWTWTDLYICPSISPCASVFMNHSLCSASLWKDKSLSTGRYRGKNSNPALLFCPFLVPNCSIRANLALQSHLGAHFILIATSMLRWAMNITLRAINMLRTV